MSNIHVGNPPDEWENWERHVVHFHHFESLPTEKGHKVTSPKFRCFDHEWKLWLRPGGDDVSRDGMVALHLEHCSGSEISSTFQFLIRDTNEKVVEEAMSDGYHKFPEGKEWGWKDFIERAEIIDPSNYVLNDGTLTVEVRIKPDDDHCCLNFIPKHDYAQNILQLFQDKDTSDVVFEVKEEEAEAGAQLPTSTLFHAHKLILCSCAKGSTLTSLCEESDKSTPVPIVNVDPQVFHLMLYHIYGGKIRAAEWKERAKDFIDAADRYGVKTLKIEAEAWYVKHLEISVDNVIDALVYAEEKNCFLLKEVATNFVLNNANEVLASESFEDIPESKIFVREIISLAATSNRQDEAKRDLEDPRKLSINELRAQLYDQGKDIDGPRNRLIAQLLGDEEDGIMPSESEDIEEEEDDYEED